MKNPTDWESLRAAALRDIREFTPAGFYRDVNTDRDAFGKDFELARRLRRMHLKDPQLTPRQLAAVRLLESIWWCVVGEDPLPKEYAHDPAEIIAVEEVRELWLSMLQDDVNRYVLHLSEDEARALTANPETAGSAKPTTSKLERRIAAIVDTARNLGYDPTKVATGGKAAIKKLCLEDATLFTDSTFDAAWKAARKDNRIDVENVAVYRKR